MPSGVNADLAKFSRIECQKSIDIQTEIADKPICCDLPNIHKSNPSSNYRLS